MHKGATQKGYRPPNLPSSTEVMRLANSPEPLNLTPSTPVKVSVAYLKRRFWVQLDQEVLRRFGVSESTKFLRSISEEGGRLAIVLTFADRRQETVDKTVDAVCVKRKPPNCTA